MKDNVNLASGADIVIFIDESGNESLNVDKAGVTPLFVAGAVVVKRENLPAIREGVLRIEDELSGGKAAKSSGIGNAHKRRLDFVERASQLPFEFLIEAVDKRRLQRDTGLEHKRSFRKFLLSFLYERLYLNYSGAGIVADRHGSPEYQTQFKEYMARKLPEDLFHQAPTIEFAESTQEPGLRLVDWVAGTYSVGLENRFADPLLRQCRERLRAKELHAHIWPPPSPRDPGVRPGPRDCDSALREIMLGRASEFVEQNHNSADESVRAQASVVSFLLSEQMYESPAERRHYLASTLLQALVQRGFREISEQAFRRAILGPIRDAGIVLSGSSSGMRIATCMEDVEDYRDHVRSVILPMIGRLKRCRDDLRLHKELGVDILNGPGLDTLRSIVDALGDAKLLAYDGSE